MKILIGSKALASYSEFSERTVKDVDYFTDAVTELLPTHENGLKLEPFYHQAIVDYFGNGVTRTATLEELYTIKVSHIFWDLKNNSWDKHACDIMKMQEKDIKLIPELYKLLYKVWIEVHGNKKANLSQMADSFFKDGVTRIYVHDSIHASVAYYDAPLYERILMDGEEVKVDKLKFDAMSHEDKIKLVREEVYATALERLVVPSGYKYSPRRAYGWALRRTVTSLARGWFALYIVENLRELWKPDCDYVQRHLDNKDKLILLENTK